jgi:hypothetical protein
VSTDDSRGIGEQVAFLNWKGLFHRLTSSWKNEGRAEHDKEGRTHLGYGSRDRLENELRVYARWNQGVWGVVDDVEKENDGARRDLMRSCPICRQLHKGKARHTARLNLILTRTNFSSMIKEL